jgi:hypothetical protein
MLSVVLFIFHYRSALRPLLVHPVFHRSLVVSRSPRPPAPVMFPHSSLDLPDLLLPSWRPPTGPPAPLMTPHRSSLTPRILSHFSLDARIPTSPPLTLASSCASHDPTPVSLDDRVSPQVLQKPSCTPSRSPSTLASAHPVLARISCTPQFSCPS